MVQDNALRVRPQRAERTSRVKAQVAEQVAHRTLNVPTAQFASTGIALPPCAGTALWNPASNATTARTTTIRKYVPRPASHARLVVVEKSARAVALPLRNAAGDALRTEADSTLLAAVTEALARMAARTQNVRVVLAFRRVRRAVMIGIVLHRPRPASAT